ncbi:PLASMODESMATA CALLOSE-BINDING PROTEIN 3 [Bienertia sinuspersici]
MKHFKILEMAKNLNMLIDVSVKDSSNNAESFVNSPLILPPYNSLSPNSLPDSNNSPPYCIYPPPNPQSPTTPSPVDSFLGPPSSPIGITPSPIAAPDTYVSPPGPPNFEPSPGPPTSGEIPGPPASGGDTPSPPEIGDMPSPPTSGDIPGPPTNTPGPPTSGGDIPSPPSGNIPSPPELVPSPVGLEPSPPVFEPPDVYPPPSIPPPRSSGGGGSGGGGRGSGRVWCVAKPSVPDPIIQEAMNYACGSGADCGPIQPNGPCFHPNTILAHASYAFNSYWQRTKVAGGTCSFGGTAILVTVDPSKFTPH